MPVKYSAGCISLADCSALPEGRFLAALYCAGRISLAGCSALPEDRFMAALGSIMRNTTQRKNGCDVLPSITRKCIKYYKRGATIRRCRQAEQAMSGAAQVLHSTDRRAGCAALPRISAGPVAGCSALLFAFLARLAYCTDCFRLSHLVSPVLHLESGPPVKLHWREGCFTARTTNDH